MSRAKPTLGYPSRTAAVLALRARGHGTADIARMIGISPAAVAALESSDKHQRAVLAARESRLRADGLMRTPALTSCEMVVGVSPALFKRLRHAAEERSITPSMLAVALLAAVLRDNLIDAVMDDGVLS